MENLPFYISLVFGLTVGFFITFGEYSTIDFNNKFSKSLNLGELCILRANKKYPTIPHYSTVGNNNTSLSAPESQYHYHLFDIGCLVLH